MTAFTTLKGRRIPVSHRYMKKKGCLLFFMLTRIRVNCVLIMGTI